MVMFKKWRGKATGSGTTREAAEAEALAKLKAQEPDLDGYLLSSSWWTGTPPDVTWYSRYIGYFLEDIPPWPPPPGLYDHIIGTITDKATGRLIPLATVRWKGWGAMSKPNGMYELMGIPTGTGIIEFSIDGYRTLEKTITYPGGQLVVDAELEWISPTIEETDLQKAWREFFENPDVITAIGLTPSSVQESFSLVFSNYSIINDRDQSPETGDYVSVGLILGGIALALSPLIYAAVAAVPGIGTSGMMKGMVGVTGAGAKSFFLKIGSLLGLVKVQTTLSGGLVRATKAASPNSSPWIKALVIWNVLTDWVWIQEMLRDMGAAIAGDLDRRATNLRYTLNQQMRELNNKINFAEEDQDWAEIRKRVDAIDPLLIDYVAILEEAGVKDRMPEVWAELELMLSNFKEFRDKAYKETEMPIFPEKIIVEDAMVEDGDTLHWPGHPEAQDKIRFMGIDTHEIGTTAGKEEADYLKSLIEHRTVTIYVDPHEQTGTFGRLLGVPFLGDQNILISMLEKFGKSILTPTKYQDRHKYVDWHELERAAARAVPKIAKVKVYTKPAYARLFIDGVDTRKISIETFELDVGREYVIGAKKKDYLGFDQPVTVPPEGTEIRIELKKRGTAAPVKVYSDPSMANIFIDGIDMVKLTPETFDLDIGRKYRIAVSKGGHARQEKSVTVPLGGAELSFDLLTEEEERAEDKPEFVVPFKIKILSTPLRAKVYIDGVYTHHLTASDEKELSDVMHLLTPGMHTIRVTKEGKAAELEVEIKPGFNEPIYLTLEVIGIAKTKEFIEAEISRLRANIETLMKELEALK